MNRHELGHRHDLDHRLAHPWVHLFLYLVHHRETPLETCDESLVLRVTNTRCADRTGAVEKRDEDSYVRERERERDGDTGGEVLKCWRYLGTNGVC